MYFLPIQFIAAFALLTLPWLNPFAPGPSPAVVPWLVGLAVTTGLILLASLRASLGKSVIGASFAQRWVFPVAWAWVIAGMVSSGIGLLQYFGAAGALGPWVNQASLGEAFANLRQRNQFASLTNMAVAALLWLAMSGRFVGRRQWLVWAAAALLAAGNAASSSRTGLLQLAVLCALCWFWGGWRQPAVRRVLLAAVVAYALATLALPWLAGFDLWEHGMTGRLRAGDPACASRLTLWSNVLHLIAQKPWFGWGWGELDYAHYMTRYPGKRFCDILDNAHNLPLHLAVELGIPAALLVCGLATWLVLRARPWRETDPTRQMAWNVLALILLHSMLEYPLWYGPFQMAVGLCVLLLWRGAGMEGPPKYQLHEPLAQITRSLSAIFLIAIVAYAAWDYRRISQIYRMPEARDEAYRDNTLVKIRDSRLFRNQVNFAELSLTPLTRDNAQWTFNTATALLHYSPEPRVIEKLIESAVMLGRDEEAVAHMARYRAAFPVDYARWTQANKERLPGLPQRMP
jgi:O-antigen ligase